ncbi:hypothetical protein [Lachnoclostridium phytofermentans]|nr:hypothetical protein [Lachnoclostridium phytofermentans]
MKLKYYMRGIGVGILFSTMVFFIVGNGKPQMTDEQIIKAAKELGMEEKRTVDLSGLNPTPTIVPDGKNEDANHSANATQDGTNDKDNIPSITPGIDGSGVESLDAINDTKKGDENSLDSDESKKDNESSLDNNGSTVDKNSSADNQNSSVDSNASKSEESTDNDSVETITLVIKSGMFSHHVADLCKTLGLVEDAKEFDSYLIKNGYAGKIRTNRYEIPVGASYEDIAGLITIKPRY